VAEDGGDTKEVVILDKQVVGPFIAVTLDATEAGAELLLQWLDDNDFDQPESSLPIIDHYLQQGFNFIAVKLKESATVGDLQPLMLTMPEAEEPCIPLVLTRIAAAPDMPVTAWVFGEHRIVPLNWFGVDINYKKIDWLSNGGNYLEVATEAVNDAAGHAFITEYAQSTSTQNMLFSEGQFDTGVLATINDPDTFLQEMLMQGFPRNAQMQSLIQIHIPKPAEENLPEGCKTDQEFYTWNLSECLKNMPEDWAFDPATFASDLESKIVGPLKDAQTLLDRVSNDKGEAYLTRLFSTVSPDEMTRDPIFGFNRDLGDVSPWHSVQGVATCNEDDQWVMDSYTLTHEGESWTVEGPFEDIWMLDGSDFVDGFPEENASGEIVIFKEEGQPILIALDEVAQQEQTFEMMDPTFLAWDGEPSPTSTNLPGDTDAGTGEPNITDGEDEGGCNTGGHSNSLALLFALMTGLIALRPRFNL